MKLFKIKFSLLIVLLVSFLTNGCRRDIEFASWDADVLSPIAHGELNLTNMLLSNDVVADSSGLIHLLFSDTLIKLGLDSIIGIPDTSLKDQYLIPVNFTLPTGVPFYDKTNETKYNLKDIELTYAEVRSSLFSVKLTNSLSKQIIVTYTIASATLDGDTFVLQEFVPGKSTFNGQFNLDGYALDLRGVNGTSINTLVSSVNVMVDPAEGPTYQFKAGESFGIETSFQKIVPQYAVGYFGSRQTLFQDATALDVFDKIPFRSMDITEFDVVMTIDNGIGADLQLKIDELGSSNLSTGLSSSLQHPIIGQTQQLSRAVNLFNSENPVKHILKKFVFNDQNSNLDQLLEIRPSSLFYAVDLSINPLGNISLGNDFVYYGHDISVSMDLDVPLKIGVSGLVLQDTFAVAFEEEDPSNGTGLINNGFIRAYFDNGYPLAATVQLYLQDENGVEIDSLLNFAQSIIAAEADFNGEVALNGLSTIEVPVDQDKIEKLRLTKSIRLKAVIETYIGDVVNIYDDYSLSFKLVADLNVNTK